VTAPDDVEVLRRLEQLAAVKPDANATLRALERVRTALTNAPAPRSQWRIPMALRIAACVLVLAGGTVLLLAWIRPSQAAPTFAEVQEKVQGTRAIRFMQNLGLDPPSKKSLVYMQVPGLVRLENPDGTFFIRDNEKHQSLAVDPKGKRAVLTLGLADENGFLNFFNMIRDAAQDVIENLPEQIIDGKKAIGYRVRMGVGQDKKKEASVWVDPKTKLPVRIEMNYKDMTGREVLQRVWSDFVFDAPLDAALFRTTPPEGYVVVTRGLATPLPAPPAEADKRAPLVIPGVGIGSARFGMSKEEVIKALGLPDYLPPEGKGNQLEYLSRGFGLKVEPLRGLVRIDCVTRRIVELKVNDFQGKTKEDIAMGDNEKKIVVAYGEPDLRETHQEMTQLHYFNNYPHMSFNLVDDKLIRFALTTPEP
jgi:outer membrane lipoprotein-sorting protein